MLLVNAVNTEGRPLEIFVKDGRIAAVGQELEALAGDNETVVDAGGLTVLPAFVDLHCHWRTPGFEYKEDVETGSRAAAAGGYTFVNLMPNTKPVCSSAAQAMQVEQKAAEVGLCDVNQTVSITENFDGVSIDHLKTLPAGVKFITEDGHGVQDNATMAKAFAICTQKDITVMSHAEDMEISPWDYRLAEDIETVRNCWLSEYYQTKLHMCHVSTRGALDAIQMAKLRGAPVTCEVTPHHLWFTNDTCDYRVNPPIRTADDVQALVDGIRTGIVDAIATDHAPHSEEDKLKGMSGMVGSETAFGVCYTKLCKQEGLPLEVLVHLMSTRPAEILGLAKGQLEPGYDADMVLAGNTARKNKGGLAFALNGQVVGELPLPVAGLMSTESAEAVEEKLQALKAALKAHGISEDIDAFMTLAFVSLPVIPKLRLNTYGIVDVDAQQIVPAVF